MNRLHVWLSTAPDGRNPRGYVIGTYGQAVMTVMVLAWGLTLVASGWWLAQVGPLSTAAVVWVLLLPWRRHAVTVSDAVKIWCYRRELDARRDDD